MMEQYMIPSVHHPKVLDTVVILDAVYMMDDLVITNRPAKVLFHEVSMLGDVAPIDPDQDVTSVADRPGTAPVPTLPGTIARSILSPAPFASWPKHRAADRAGQGDGMGPARPAGAGAGTEPRLSDPILSGMKRLAACLADGVRGTIKGHPSGPFAMVSLPRLLPQRGGFVCPHYTKIRTVTVV